MNPEIQQLTDRMNNHRHDGNRDQRINLDSIVGLIRIVDAVPTWTPRNMSEQFAIYSSGATYRFYWYDSVNNAWRYATGA